MNIRTLLNSNDFSGLLPLPFGYNLVTTYPGGNKLYFWLYDAENTLILNNHITDNSGRYNIDDLRMVMQCLSFACVRLGDTDKEYFDNYTVHGLKWIESAECEYIAAMVSDYEQYDKEDPDTHSLADNYMYFKTVYRQDLSPRYGLYNVIYRSPASHNPNTAIVCANMNIDEVITYCLTAAENREQCEYYRGENYVPGSKRRSYSRMWEARQVPMKYTEIFNELKFLYKYLYNENI